MNAKNTLKLSAVALALSQSLYATNIIAQENEQDEVTSKDVEVIQVRGFGASMGKALREKRFSDAVVEVISTDDLGLLPDVSITDSLVRLPGVAASRDRGNASQISIRGMGARLNIATMNDREIVTAEPSRNVRFEQFPAELIDSVQVYKSPVASKAEGGISGLVNMNFVSPLAREESKLTLSGHITQNELGDDLPEVDGMGSKANISYVGKVSDTFGFALGFTYQDQASLGKGVQSWDYNNGGNRGDLNENGLLEHAPWGVMAVSKRGNNERTGGLAVIEWQPTESFTLKGDLFYSQFDITERDDQMGPADLGNWADSNSGPRGWAAGAYDGSSVAPVIVKRPDGSEQIVSGSQYNNGLDVSVPTWFQTNEMLASGLNGKYIGDVWTINFDVGYSEASIESVWVDINPIYVGGDYDLGFNVQGTDIPEIILHSGNISDPGNYSLGAVQDIWAETSPGVWEIVAQEFTGAQMIGDNPRQLTDDMLNFNLDFERDIESGVFTKVKFGGRITDRTKENYQLNNWTKTAIQDHGLTDFGISYDIGGGYNVPAIYTFADWDRVVAQAFGGLVAFDDPANSKDNLASWVLEETNTAAYVQFDMSGELGGVPFTGNVGLRYVNTQVHSMGYEYNDVWIEGDDGVWYQPDPSPVDVEHDYNELLPSLNMLFNVTDDSQIRLGIARTLSRPPLLEMRTGFALDTTAQPPTANGGNPTLDPYIANQFDIGYEYYWGENSAATINLFYKNLESHIGISEGTVDFNGTTYQFSGTLNGDGGVIKGVELMYQQQFEQLPEPWDGLGMFANYSYTDSDVMEFAPEDNPYTLGGLSKHVGNLTLWYAQDAFDIRISYNYRSEYTGINSWQPSRVNLNDDESTLDASIGYQVMENLRITLQGYNLTNEASQSYWDNDKSKPAANLQWGRRFLLGFQYSI